MSYLYLEISTLIGRTLKSCVQSDGNEEIRFTTVEGDVFKLYHQQDCCECVYVEDICGELSDLVGSPITQAEENSSSDDPPDRPRGRNVESMTWTFYRLATAKGQVVLRWCGESNGYYSESVQFAKVTEGDV